MSTKSFNGVLVIIATIALMYPHAWAQPNCAPFIASLAPCLGFISGNSSAPSSSCCTQFSSVVQTQAQCLCTFVNGAPQLPFVVNQTQALTLPGACKVQAPPLSQCQAVGSPQTAPSPAAAAAAPSTNVTPPKTTPSTPAVPTGPTGSGSKTVPTTGHTSSAKSSVKFAPSALFVLFLTSAVYSF